MIIKNVTTSQVIYLTLIAGVLSALTFGQSSALGADDLVKPSSTDSTTDQLQMSLSETYLPYCAANGAARWPANRIPITYHITEGEAVSGYKPAFKTAMESAMNAWTNASGGKLSFQPVDARNAALQISWTDDTNKMNFAQELGHTEVLCDGNGIVSATMLLLTKQVGGAAIGDMFAKRVALHELGHALGILGHSPNSQDVMFAATTPSDDPNLSKKDTNTILALYSSSGDSFVNNLKADKLTDLGSNASPAMQAMHLNAEAAEALKSMKFAFAMQKFEQAHKLDPSNQVVITNLGNTYANVAAMASMMHKPQDAENYFKKAIAILELSNNHAALIPVLSNYSSILKASNRVDEGMKLDAKIRALTAGK